MAKPFVLAMLGVAVLVGIWLLSPAKQPPVEQAYAPTAIINGHVLELEIARTQEEQQKGLSGRAELAENAGMLFVYEQPAMPGFWMPDMHFAIDIIWIDENRKIVGVTSNISPETYPEIFRPPSPIMYVLETNARWAQDHDITVGDEVVFNF